LTDVGGLTWENHRTSGDFLSLLVFLVSAIGLPYAVAVFVDEQRKKRGNKNGG
jgi:hypothetical protein